MTEYSIHAIYLLPMYLDFKKCKGKQTVLTMNVRQQTNVSPAKRYVVILAQHTSIQELFIYTAIQYELSSCVYLMTILL